MANEVNTRANADTDRRQMKGREILTINGLNNLFDQYRLSQAAMEQILAQ